MNIEKFINQILKDAEKAKKEREKNFKKAHDLGLQNGDVVIFKDGDIEFVDDCDNCFLRYKHIAEVRRPVEWETVEIKKTRRMGRRKTKFDVELTNKSYGVPKGAKGICLEPDSDVPYVNWDKHYEGTYEMDGYKNVYAVNARDLKKI